MLSSAGDWRCRAGGRSDRWFALTRTAPKSGRDSGAEKKSKKNVKNVKNVKKKKIATTYSMVARALQVL